jgi:hypothetical protein
MKMMRGFLGLFVLVALDGCVPGEPPGEGPFCGGIAGIACPGAGVCLDDPSDDCDPRAGGADCGGVCHCQAVGVCTNGMHWDDSADVCGCVADENPCGDVTCAPGLVCCNASCGICTPPGEVCIQIACD